MSKSAQRANHNFAQIPMADIPRSSFRRDNGLKTTFDEGYLIPIYCDEALPGDTFRVNMSAFVRMATPIKPIMDNIYCDVFFFSVANRLVWSNWKKFNGEQNNPGDSTDYIIPTITAPVGGFANQTIFDYLGLPTLIPGYVFSALYNRSDNLIYNEWFRDQNLQNSVPVNLGDGPDAPTDYALKRRGKRHDYFTSALPWPQKGPSVSIPLSGDAPVKGLGFYQTLGTGPSALSGVRETATASVNWPFGFGVTNAGFVARSTSNNASNSQPMIYADLASVSGVTINQLRQSIQIQRLYERDARGGTRYTEILKSHFGVTSPDARLQRPEYLGGGSFTININPIAQTSSLPDQPTPQGNLAAMGVGSINRVGFTKSFTEHSIVLGYICVRADLTYQNGLDKKFTRSTRWDFYWPALSHIGEQAILNKEIYCQGSGNAAQDAAVFGYQERFAEYRYKPSRITGKFRSNDPQTLDYWHLAQKFTSLPVLNAAFIVEDAPIERVVAVPSEPKFLADLFFDETTARPMPVYGVPGLMDHF